MSKVRCEAKFALLQSVAAAAVLAIANLTGCATVNGPRGAAASAVGIPLPAAAASVVTAKIAKGEPDHLLLVQATIQELGIVPPGGEMLMYPTVNGLGFEPDTSSPSASQVWKGCKNPYLATDGSGDYPTCSFTGTWWLDLDAAEAAHPGVIKMQPLVIDLNAVSSNGVVSYANVSLTVQLVKK